jgi:hypothetical protein
MRGRGSCSVAVPCPSQNKCSVLSNFLVILIIGDNFLSATGKISGLFLSYFTLNIKYIIYYITLPLVLTCKDVNFYVKR